jgi:hypothetical protein
MSFAVLHNDLDVNQCPDPETAGRSLEEIDEIFTASKSIFDPVRIAKKLPKQHLSTFLQEEAKHDAEIKDAVQKIEHIDNASSDPEAVTEKSITEKSDDVV